MPTRLALVISTGRCGTQWLGAKLGEIYKDDAIVEHGVLAHKYKPNQLFRNWHTDDPGGLTQQLSEHLGNINSTLLDGKHYVDVSWTTYGAIPALITQFEDRVRLIHLHRHPVHVALSYVSHRFYRPELRSDWFTEWAQLTPRCPGVYPTSCDDRWSILSPYEKALFHWYQLNKYAQEVHERWPTLPYFSVCFDDLFHRTAKRLDELVEFLELEPRAVLSFATRTVIDAHSLKLDPIPDWRQIFKFPEVVELATALGYGFTAINEKQIERRYKPNPGPETALCHRPWRSVEVKQERSLLPRQFSRFLGIWRRE